MPLVGVLALQGGFAAHAAILEALGARTREVRVPADLRDLDALVLPGGESTTMALGIAREGLAEPLRDFCASGAPVLGTCAGMIVLADGQLGVVDMTVRRNAFGRQLHSFEEDVELDGLDGEPVRAVFIRAPWIERAGPDVRILGEVAGRPVAARQDAVTVVAFHPELSGETRLHERLLAEIA